MSHAALEPRVPAAVLGRFEGPHDAVWLVANNPRLLDWPLRELPIGRDGLLVQFNRALCFERFADLDCHKDFLFTAVPGGYHGLAGTGEPERDLAAQRRRRLRVGFLGGEPEAHEQRLAQRLSVDGWLSTPFGTVVMRGYPRRLVASSGFVVAQAHLALEASREARGLPRRPVHLVGFTGYGPSAWRGHDWWGEQQALRRGPGRLHAMAARAPLHRLRALRWWLHHGLALRHGRKA